MVWYNGYFDRPSCSATKTLEIKPTLWWNLEELLPMVYRIRQINSKTRVIDHYERGSDFPQTIQLRLQLWEQLTILCQEHTGAQCRWPKIKGLWETSLENNPCWVVWYGPVHTAWFILHTPMLYPCAGAASSSLFTHLPRIIWTQHPIDGTAKIKCPSLVFQVELENIHHQFNFTWIFNLPAVVMTGPSLKI